ncbi:MAG: 50S ribosomal protein L18 [Clostridia bacterium]|nr:50S ribosomal protein L18 [Clostridia bacterium]MDD4386406.1 50S ribosomal protein L18 [Clostridia bacterium]
MINKKSRNETRMIKQKRVRAKVLGTAARPRLCVFRSLNNIFVQVINDDNATTICEASTLNTEIKTKASNIASATEVGTLIAKRLLEKDIKTVVFDRNGYVYHGKVKAVAEAAREAGLQF